MLQRTKLAALVWSLSIGTAAAFDAAMYPDFSGQWKRPPGVGVQWDQTKKGGLAQQAPFTPEYQARLEASISDQARRRAGRRRARELHHRRHAAHHDRDAAV